jgi:hypothetical protein
MDIMIWVDNQDRDFLNKAKEFALVHFPGHKLLFRNPQFFNNQIERADVIIVSKKWNSVVEGYKAHNAKPDVPYQVQIIDDLATAPKFKIVPVEDHKEEETLDEPDLGFMGKGQTNDKGPGTAKEEYETGSIGASLASILGDLGDSVSDKNEAASGEPDSNELVPGNAASEDTAKSKPSKKKKKAK